MAIYLLNCVLFGYFRPQSPLDPPSIVLIGDVVTPSDRGHRGKGKTASKLEVLMARKMGQSSPNQG